MSLSQALLAEFEVESNTTRRFLQAIPPEGLTWKPHPKSHTTGELAFHIATIPGRIAELAVPDSSPLPDKPWTKPATVEEILQAFEESAATARRILATFADEAMGCTVSLTMGGQVLLSLPRATFLRMVMFNHLYHHRGQLGVYLRLLGAKVPGAYGPSGDEGPGAT